jgi:hypothetical protein
MALQLCRRNKDFEMKSSGFGLCFKLFNNNVFTGREVPRISDHAKAVQLHAMKALGGERSYSSYSFSTSALDGGE